MVTAAYVRTSTKDQDGLTQRHAIERACMAREKAIDEWFEDVGWSGAKATRPALDRLVRAVHAGDVTEVVVYKLDRLGRSLQHLVQVVDTMRQAACNLVSIQDGLDFATPGGRLQAGMMMLLAEYEREMILERTRAGLDRLKAEAVRLDNPLSHKLGSPTALTPDQLAEARDMRGRGVSWRKVAKAIDAPVSTVRGALARGTDYIVVPAGEWRRDLRRGVRECPPEPTPRKRRRRAAAGATV